MPKTVTEKDQKIRKTQKNVSQNGMRGGRAECLHPAQHPLQHLTLKLLRTQIRERCLRQTKRRESAEKVCDERVPESSRARKKMQRRQMCVEIKEQRNGAQHSPSGAKRPGGEFSVACGNGSAPGPP